jgi:hypothetical protein
MIGRREVAVVLRWQLRPGLYLLRLMRALTAIILYLLVHLFLPPTTFITLAFGTSSHIPLPISTERSKHVHLPISDYPINLSLFDPAPFSTSETTSQLCPLLSPSLISFVITNQIASSHVPPHDHLSVRIHPVAPCHPVERRDIFERRTCM